MEIDVTDIVSEDCSQFSSSIWESGLTNISQITWNNSVKYVEDNGWQVGIDQDELRDWIREFGAWDDKAVKDMSDVETRALLLQFVAGNIREMEDFDTYEDYQQAAEDGQVSGSLYKGDDDNWYFYVGN